MAKLNNFKPGSNLDDLPDQHVLFGRRRLPVHEEVGDVEQAEGPETIPMNQSKL